MYIIMRYERPGLKQDEIEEIKEAFDLFAHHLDEVSLDLDVAPVTCLRRSEFFCRARTSQAPTSFLGYL